MGRIMDHRNEGFTPKDAFYEDGVSRAKMINRSITTKEGLKDYTKDEIAERSGEVVEYNYNKRYSWDVFKNMPEINRREYIVHLTRKYDGLRLVDLARMFDMTTAAVSPLILKTKIRFPKGGARYMNVGRIKFYEEMFEPVEESKDYETYPVEEKGPDITEAQFEFLLNDISFVTELENIPKVLECLNLSDQKARVRITIEAIEQ